MKYNSYLLNEAKSVDDKAALLNLLKNISVEEREALMKEVGKD